MHISNLPWLGVVVLLAATARLAFAADVLTLADGRTLTGTFLGYRGDQFEMQVGDNKPTKVPQLRVATLSLSPAASVKLRRHGGKNLDGIQLNRYQKPNFIFTTEAGELKITGIQVATIEAHADMRREMEHVAEADRAQRPVAPHDASVALPIHTGVVTVVHFHMESVLSSVRQGGYIRSRCADSRGKVTYERVDISGWDDPVAKRYGIASVPQFWFYDQDGAQQTKLTDRFTYEDIDAALAASGGGRGSTP